jgi:hypothetical protein
LRELSREGKGAYISSRVSEDKLARQLPSLDRRGRQANDNFEFLDIRLGTGASLIQEVIGMVRAQANVRTIVLDTWDGLAKEMNDLERLKAEKTLASLADSMKVRMIFVSEEPARTTVDYLVDGIIELVRSEHYDRVFRDVEVLKLRGTAIDQHKYLYTLLGGRFAHFPAYVPPSYAKMKRFEPIPDHQRPDGVYYSFGCSGVDAAFGGIKKGSVFTIEYTEAVPYSAIRTLELGTIVNFLGLGRSVALTPLPGASEADIEYLVAPLVSKEAWSNNFALTGVARATKTTNKVSPKNKELAGSVPQDDGFNSEAEDALESVETIKKNSVDGSLLYVESLSMSENVLASDIGQLLEALSLRISRIQRKRSADSMLLLLQSDSLIRSRILSLSSGHARMFVKDRTVLLLGEKPSTQPFVLEHEPDNPLLPLLTKIV